jgi:putative colanic acid biosynthesis UDP-glucose lipid carrier transferase
MSALQESSLSPRLHDSPSRHTHTASGTWERPDAGEPLAVVLTRQHLNSVVAAATLLVAALALGERIGAPYVALAAFAYVLTFRVVTQPRLENDGGATDWARILRHRTIEWACVAGILLLAGYLLEARRLFPRAVLLAWFVATPLALAGSHAAARVVARRVFARAAAERRMIIVGANRIGCELDARLAAEPWQGKVAGFFDDRQVERLPQAARSRVLGKYADLPEYLRQNLVHVVYICLPISRHPRIRTLLDLLGDTAASIYFVPDLSAFDLIQARFGQVSGMPLVAVRESPFCGTAGVLKRGSDVLLAAGALLLLAPLLAAIALLVRRSSPGPALFRQRRFGLDGREFVVYKFRTMTVCEDEPVMQATRLDLRVTPIGRFLRRTSLDELPQLLNVLSGSMSLVGPRPHAVAHNQHYRKLVSGYMLRHKVRPGITGLSQVNGLRGETVDVEKMRRRVELDIEYLKNWSLGLDVRILLKTLRVMWNDKSAY